MTLTFVVLWSVAVVLSAFGCWIPAGILVGIATLAGARWWLQRKTEAAFMPPPVRNIH